MRDYRSVFECGPIGRPVPGAHPLSIDHPERPAADDDPIPDGGWEVHRKAEVCTELAVLLIERFIAVPMHRIRRDDLALVEADRDPGVKISFVVVSIPGW